MFLLNYVLIIFCSLRNKRRFFSHTAVTIEIIYGCAWFYNQIGEAYLLQFLPLLDNTWYCLGIELKFSQLVYSMHHRLIPYFEWQFLAFYWALQAGQGNSVPWLVSLRNHNSCTIKKGIYNYYVQLHSYKTYALMEWWKQQQNVANICNSS